MEEMIKKFMCSNFIIVRLFKVTYFCGALFFRPNKKLLSSETALFDGTFRLVQFQSLHGFSSELNFMTWLPS